MASSLTSLPIKTIRRLQRARAVKHGDLLLPPPSLRLGGAHFRDDKVFVESGREDARKLRAVFGCGASSSILDIGCGVGRLPIGLMAEFGELADYVGVDVNNSSVEWCKRHIETHHPQVSFTHLNVANARYNRRGDPINESFQLPWDSSRFDIIFLYSVFSHMESDDVRAYLREFRRLLKPGRGGVFLTAFIEEDVPDMEVNPRGYGPLKWTGALHCVRYSTSYFNHLVDEADFSTVKTDYGTETDGQSAIYLSSKP